MATWAKNQIAKQLAKFAKNLDPSSLSLKFFKGEGELNNLELNETMLSDLLEFPPWLQLTKVTCNKITAKVPWTSLKSDPIRLHLDRVEVQIVASEVAREKANNLPSFANKSNAKPTKYGFAEKVVDGMYVSINTVLVSFTSLGFKASVNVSRIIVQSTTPDWKQTNNLRQTRIKDDAKGETLNFKEIRWGTMRVDADASYKPESQDIPSTPLRLITNNSAVRLVIKKRMSDCQMLASKLGVILDDILWVLTRSQILKLSSFIHYLIKLRSKFLPIAHQSASQLHKQDTPTQTQQQSTPPSQNQLFSAYDLTETSIHLRTQRIDLHLCDDSSLDGNLSQSSTNETYKKFGFDEPGAALQISLINISLDHCPYHIVGRKRTVLSMDDEVAYQRKKWATQLMNNFQETEGKRWSQPRNSASILRNPSRKRRPVMYESFVAAMVQDFQIMQVTTPKSKDPQPFLNSEKETLFLPKEMASIHIDHTTYYYMPVTEDFPVPAPNVFIQINPIQLTFDPLTCVWLNRFAQSVVTGLDWTKEFMSNESGFVEHVDVRIEALMPKITIPLENDSSLQHLDERPSGMQIQISQAVVSNCRVGGKCSQADILNDLQSFLSSRHYADLSCFPNQPTDFSTHSNSTWLNDFSINYHQLLNLTKRDKGLYARLKRDGNLPHHVWCVWCDQFWIEFTGIGKASNRPVTFLDAFPLRLWICQDVPYYSPAERSVSPESASSFEMACDMLEDDGVSAAISTMPRKSSSDSFVNLSPRNPGDSPLHIPSNVSVIPEVISPNRSTFYSDFDENVTTIRAAHSDTDLSFHQSSIPETRSLHDFNNDKTNYAQGGPPPPYSSNQVDQSFSATSVVSLPPAYDDAVLPHHEEAGVLDEKTPITDIVDYNEETSHKANVALLLNVTKNIQIQLDHFQMIFLIRISEVFQAVADKITFDNERCDHERRQSLHQFNDVQQKDEPDESMTLNISIPNIILDLILHPCAGIEPIQQLNLSDRMQYEKQKSMRDILLNGMEQSFLPVQRTSNSVSSTPTRSTPNRSRSSSNASSSITFEQAHLERDPLRSDARHTDLVSLSKSQSYHNQLEHSDVQGIHSSQSAPLLHERTVVQDGQFIQEASYPEYEYDDTLKEVCDVAVQAGDSLMKVNLKPRPEHQLVSILRVRLGSVTVGIQSEGKESVVKVAAETLEVNERGNTKYGKTLDPRGNIIPEKHKDKQQINMNTLTGNGVFKMRLITGPSAEQFATGSGELGFADIRINSLAAGLLMTTIDNLTEFAEDEFVLPTMPFVVNITNADISMYDDKPRRYKSAIKLPPQQILINTLHVQRDTNGVITLNYNNQENSNTEEASQNNLSVHNTEETFMSRQHSASVNSASIAESINQQVEALIGENGRLLEDLKVVNAKVNGLHVERDSLIKVIDKLQQELMVSNRENDELHHRFRSLSLSKSRDQFK